MAGEIIIVISPDGSSVKTEVQGIKGKSCEDVTKQLVKAFGEIEASSKTFEYYMQEEGVVPIKM